MIMKSVLPFFACTLLQLSLIASVTQGKNSLKFSASDTSKEVHDVMAQLINKDWLVTTEDLTRNTRASIFRFNGNGKASLTHQENNNGDIVTHYNWYLKRDMEGLVVALEHESGTNKKLLRIESSNGGFIIRDFLEEQAIFLTKPIPNIKSPNSDIVEALIGKWENALYSIQPSPAQPESGVAENNNDVFLNFSFYRNGQYKRQLNQLSMSGEETGTWKVSDDGRWIHLKAKAPSVYLFLFFLTIIMDC